MTQIARTRRFLTVPVAKPLKMPQFKIGDIVKFREFNGRLYTAVVKSIDEATGEVGMREVKWSSRFHGEVKRRLEAGEVDHDFSNKTSHEIPFTIQRHIYRPLEA